MAKIKVRLKAQRRIYIHNYIGNAAFYFKNRVSERLANREGVGLEIIAGLTLLAFEVEARFNFLGAKLIPNWEEWKPAILAKQSRAFVGAKTMPPAVRREAKEDCRG